MKKTNSIIADTQNLVVEQLRDEAQQKIAKAFKDLRQARQNKAAAEKAIESAKQSISDATAEFETAVEEYTNLD